MTSSFASSDYNGVEFVLKGRPKPDKEACTQSTAIFSHEFLPLVDKDAQ